MKFLHHLYGLCAKQTHIWPISAQADENFRIKEACARGIDVATFSIETPARGFPRG